VEDNYLLMRLAEAVDAEPPRYIPHVVAGAGDDWLLTDDEAPNAAGCDRLGMGTWEGEALRDALAGADALYVLEDDPLAAGLLTADDLAGKRVIVHPYHSTNQTAAGATVTLPAAMSVETIGTYVNDAGRAQLLRPAKAIRGMFRPLMSALGVGLSRLDRQGTPFDKWHDEGNRVDCQPGWVSLPEVAARAGADLRFKSPTAILEEASLRIPGLAGASHAAMDLQGVALEDAEQPA
jgi:NADH-quinone oxidoreductase subunit G